MAIKAKRWCATWPTALDQFLRTGARPDTDGERGELTGFRTLLWIVSGGALYGAVMSTFSYEPARTLLILYGALKVPMLFGITMLLAVPGFYVLNALRGVADDFPKVFRLLIDYQLLVVVVLMALSPLTVLVNIRNPDEAYAQVQVWNTGAFLLAALLAQWNFARQYRVLIERDSRHRLLLRLWTLLYAFIGVQMGWTLRPFIGAPRAPVVFLRETDIDNAYVEVLRVFLNALGF